MKSKFFNDKSYMLSQILTVFVFLSSACLSTSADNNKLQNTNSSGTPASSPNRLQSGDAIEEIAKAIEKKDVRRIQELLKQNPNLNVRTGDEYSLVALAVSSNDEKILQMLLEAGADPNLTSKVLGCGKAESCLKPPLYSAFEQNNLTAVKLLLQHNADANAEPILGHAVSRGYKEMVDLLLLHKADANLPDELGRTPIFVADDTILAKTLLKSGADINHADQNGFTPLTTAIQDDNLKMTRFFIKKGADVNFKNKEGQSPLEQSIAVGNKEITKALKLAGAK